MSITTIICTLSEVRDQLIELMKDEFSVSHEVAEKVYDRRVHPHFQRFQPNVRFVIEYPYIDRVYRDSYYSYFSSKLSNYKKDCIRLSLFNGDVMMDQFRDQAQISDLRNRYLGFMILRPTLPNVIGRSVISPLALVQHDFLCVMGRFQSTVCSVKFEVTGFPHSSQDTETITCAETSIWAIMEYFASKYPEYKLAPPSTIINTLENRSSFRQIPSEGLNVDQMGYALREFGFGTKIYSKAEIGEGFKNLLSTYVESGLPLIAIISNAHNGGGVGHVVLIIGHRSTSNVKIDQLQIKREQDTKLARILQQRKIQIIDNDDIERDFVSVDDNYPVYQLVSLDQPVQYYQNLDWANCEIIHFLVPLYPKIYLDALLAKKYIKQLLLETQFNIPEGTELFIRIFLTSSRSYKDYLSQDQSFQRNFRAFILGIPMSKFIWVGEISSRELIKQKKAKGLIIINATELKLINYDALVVSGYDDRFYYPDDVSRELAENLIALGEFNIYTNNLKGF
ncbi:hypothetical protein SAMN05428988_4987 [Chitinophaga sp. YR573]|uniref:hypothetical protein n=1 Tax=Chitinophaga sp. YR573 TaxID=1881040 RepID=UPI0008C6B570|nr:hypothetical protein [Chitinophaga sp. YR573]SEW39061.1 hypothetical protein SAMN05428988_4987 [Chitinophaga sp. YR573]